MVPGTIDPASPVAGNSIDPFMTRVVTLSSASLPPMAWTYLSSTWSTVGREADTACAWWPAATAFETSSHPAPRTMLGASTIRRRTRIDSARLIGRLLSGSELCLHVAADIKYHTTLGARASRSLRSELARSAAKGQARPPLDSSHADR